MYHNPIGQHYEESTLAKNNTPGSMTILLSVAPVHHHLVLPERLGKLQHLHSAKMSINKKWNRIECSFIENLRHHNWHRCNWDLHM